MIQYILECMAFQLLFLIVYDLFLKRETFFQWNRAYLIGSFVLSILLPWIKIEALKTTVSQESFVYPEYLWGMDMSAGVVGTPKPTPSIQFSTTEMVLYGGMLLAAVLFCFKLYQLYRLKRKGEIRYFESFTRIMVHNSQMAFSFFRSIFIGDKVLEKDHDSIIQHELVHIEQRHSLDLLFFELMRIIAWFNPLVYVYQNRISELHEFIADAKVAKTHKEEQYQLLLSQVFQTQNISFINHFYKSSLIKKRIVMLQKTKSKQIWRLKYLLMLPLVAGMLAYTSSEAQEAQKNDLESIALPEIVVNGSENATISRSGNWDTADVEIMDKIPVFVSCDKEADRNACFETEFKSFVLENLEYPIEAKKKGIQGRVNAMFTVGTDGSIRGLRFRSTAKIFEEEVKRVVSNLPKMISGEHMGKKVEITFTIPITFKLNEQSGIDIPFAVVEKVPVFPGCENVEDSRACFNQMMQKHISTNFRYPKEAQKKGIEGRVNIMFVIQEDGSIDNIRMRGPDTLLEEEAARIISLLPKMTPGEHRGEKVRIPFSIPITFKLSPEVIEAPAPIETDQMIDIPFSVVEKVPVFPGCENAEDKRACFNEMMQNHIRENFRYPKEAQDKNIQGRVNTLLVIQEDGSIGGVKTRGPDTLLEDEAARIISLLPSMTPGKQRGKAVRVPYSIPITFKLEGNIKNATRGIEVEDSDDIPIFPGCEDAEDKRACFEEIMRKHISKNFEFNKEQAKKYFEERMAEYISNNATASKYNELVMERERLLKNTDEKNPVIINLDQQLKALRNKIDANEIDIPFAVVDEVPVFPGCENAEDKRACFNKMMQNHIADNFRYPEEAHKDSIQGRVNILLVIQEDGRIGGVKTRGPDTLLEEEAARIISLLPSMIPGKQKGKNVRVPYSIPITFKLQ